MTANSQTTVHRKVRLAGVEFDALTEAECVAHIATQTLDGKGGSVVTPNLDHLYRSRRDPDFKKLVDNAELVVADGMPLVWASRLQGTPLPERVAGSNLVLSLSEAAAIHDLSVFFLGGNPGTAEAAANELSRRYGGLRVAGTCCPDFGFEKNEQEMDRLAQTIAAARPHIVYVALGSPKQEQVIERLQHCAPGSWWLGVGISFSFVCGDVRRAPAWMQRVGLEWFHRLLQEPKRLARRYLIEGIPFAFWLFGNATLTRLSPRTP